MKNKQEEKSLGEYIENLYKMHEYRLDLQKVLNAAREVFTSKMHRHIYRIKFFYSFVLIFLLQWYNVKGQLDFNNDNQSSENDGGALLNDFRTTNNQQDNSRLQFDDFFQNSRSANRRTTSPISGNTFDDFQLRNSNPQFRNFGSSAGNFRRQSQLSNVDGDGAVGNSRISQSRSRGDDSRFLFPNFGSTSQTQNDDSLDNFGSQLSNFDGFSSQVEGSNNNNNPRRQSSSLRRTTTTTDDDSGASSFSFSSRNFNKK